MQTCVVCDQHLDYYDDERLFDAVRTWLWEDAPYLLSIFPSMKYSAKHQDTESTMLCRSCLVNHISEWLDDAEAPIGVRQQFNKYFGTQVLQRRPVYREKKEVTRQDIVETH